MPEHIPSHVPLHTDAHHMPPILDHIGEAGLQQIDAKKDPRPQEQGMEVSLGNVNIDDVLCDHGIEQVANSHHQGAGHIQGEQAPMGLIIADKAQKHRPGMDVLHKSKTRRAGQWPGPAGKQRHDPGQDTRSPW